MSTVTCQLTGSLQKPDGTPDTDVTLTFYPVTELGGSWAADSVLVSSLTVVPDDTGQISTPLVAGAYFRLLIASPGERPQRYTVATPIGGADVDLMEMIAIGRFGWGPPGNMPMPGWGFGPGYF